MEDLRGKEAVVMGQSIAEIWVVLCKLLKKISEWELLSFYKTIKIYPVSVEFYFRPKLQQYSTFFLNSASFSAETSPIFPYFTKICLAFSWKIY